MDIVGPLTPTKSGNTHILTMQDLLSKYCKYVALSGTTSADIASVFLNCLVYIFGSPKIVLTDQGTNFTSGLIKNYVKFIL